MTWHMNSPVNENQSDSGKKKASTHDCTRLATIVRHLRVCNKLGAYEVFLRCLHVALFSIGDSWNLVVENILEAQAVAYIWSKGGHVGPCSIRKSKRIVTSATATWSSCVLWSEPRRGASLGTGQSWLGQQCCQGAPHNGYSEELPGEVVRQFWQSLHKSTYVGHWRICWAILNNVRQCQEQFCGHFKPKYNTICWTISWTSDNLTNNTVDNIE